MINKTFFTSKNSNLTFTQIIIIFPMLEHFITPLSVPHLLRLRHPELCFCLSKRSLCYQALTTLGRLTEAATVFIFTVGTG